MENRETVLLRKSYRRKRSACGLSVGHQALSEKVTTLVPAASDRFCQVVCSVGGELRTDQ